MEAQSRTQSAAGQSGRAQLGFVLSHEQFPAPRLIELGAAAEQAGFDLISTSDHFQPWQDNEGHAGLAWVTLAALGQRTSRLMMCTAVTARPIATGPPSWPRRSPRWACSIRGACSSASARARR